MPSVVDCCLLQLRFGLAEFPGPNATIVLLAKCVKGFVSEFFQRVRAYAICNCYTTERWRQQASAAMEQRVVSPRKTEEQLMASSLDCVCGKVCEKKDLKFVCLLCCKMFLFFGRRERDDDYDV